MSVTGLTTVVANTPIPEKMADLIAHAPDQLHNVAAQAVQQDIAKKASTVQKTEKSENSAKLRKKDDNERKQNRTNDKHKTDNGAGDILDLKA